MLQKFKNLFPWIIIAILSILLWSRGKEIDVLKEKNESIIDSLKCAKQNEESIIDSFSVIRISIQESRDSMKSSVDTLGIHDLRNILKFNIEQYEKIDY